MKQTRQAVHAVKKSIILRCLCVSPKVAKTSAVTITVTSGLWKTLPRYTWCLETWYIITILTLLNCKHWITVTVFFVKPLNTSTVLWLPWLPWTTWHREYHIFPCQKVFLKPSLIYLEPLSIIYRDCSFNGKPQALTPFPGKPYWRGRLSTVNLLIWVRSFEKKVNNIFSMKSSWSKLVSTRRSTVMILPLQ